MTATLQIHRLQGIYPGKRVVPVVFHIGDRRSAPLPYAPPPHGDTHGARPKDDSISRPFA